MNVGLVSNCRGIRKNGGFNQQKIFYFCIVQIFFVYFSSVSCKNVVIYEFFVLFLLCKMFKYMISDVNFVLKFMICLCSCRKEKENFLLVMISLYIVLFLIFVNDVWLLMIDFFVSFFNLNRLSLICIIFGFVLCMFMRNDCFLVVYFMYLLLIMFGNFQSLFYINYVFVEDGCWIC